MFTGRAEPIRIIGEPDNQRPDEWSFTVFLEISQLLVLETGYSACHWGGIPNCKNSTNGEFCKGVSESVTPTACLPTVITSFAYISHALSSLSCIPKSTKCNKLVLVDPNSVVSLSKNSLTFDICLAVHH